MIENQEHLRKRRKYKKCNKSSRKDILGALTKSKVKKAISTLKIKISRIT